MKQLAASVALALGSLPAFGQQATLTAATPELSSEGGYIALTAAATYDTPPSAVGWSVLLPAGWSLARTVGATAPEISPAIGSTGKLGWAFISVPASPAQVEFILQYPANLTQPKVIVAELVVCVDGKTDTIPTKRLILRRGPTRAEPLAR